MSTTHQGYLLIADITGYTMYLNRSELEHAHQVLQRLLELLIEHTRPPLVISRLAGDAVISYGLQDNFLTGQTFVELLEDTYVAFRRMIDLMVLNTTCQCNACANINTLDLKFFVHYGSFRLQKLDAHSELLGSDVIVIHRLLKNSVAEQTGIRAYTLYSDSAFYKLGIDGLSSQMTAHREAYEHIGEVIVWVQDMHPVWQAKKEAVRVTIPPDQKLLGLEILLPLTPIQAWEVITDPAYRAILTGSERQEKVNRQTGRMAPGSAYRCYHGDGSVSMQTIVDWVPFEALTTEDSTPIPKTTMLMNIRLEPAEGGTKLAMSCSKSRGPYLGRQIANLVGRVLLSRHLRKGADELLERVRSDLAAGKFDRPDLFQPGEGHIHAEVEAGLEANRQPG